MKSTETTTYHASMHRRRSQGGFTLIELLVVVVILGILSAVVVFSVRGASDKGEANARATDERIVRTAQEAFCARFGKYGTERQLAGIDEPAPGVQPTKFLSEESQYNDIRPAVDPEPRPCNGTGYVIEPVNAGPAPTGSSTTATTAPPLQGSFALTTPPPFAGREVASLVALADGKILAYAIGGLDNTALTTKAAIYEPASGLWAPATPPPPLAEPTDALGVLLADDPGTPLVNECAPRCGQVLVHAYTNWLRFNPVGPGVWEDVPAPAYSKRAFVVNGAIPLVDDPATSGIVECGQSCGKVFITAEEGGTPTADLYDPASDLFESIAYPLGLEVQIAKSRSVTRLKDGRVLMVSGRYNAAAATSTSLVYVFDPIGKSFSEVASPDHFLGVDPKAALLANGDVLFLPDDVFRPAPRGSTGTGEWTKSGGCAVATGERCAFLGAFPDGTVLSDVVNNNIATGQTRRFNPQSRTWSRSGDLVAAATSVHPAQTNQGDRAWVVLERGCGSNCGKMLIAKITAELYTR